jgi:hypothetical protein
MPDVQETTPEKSEEIVGDARNAPEGLAWKPAVEAAAPEPALGGQSIQVFGAVNKATPLPGTSHSLSKGLTRT